jgi:LETM1 and EF-hand domain-containing protein 1
MHPTHPSQLVSMCQFVGIAPFGTDAFLRNRLKSQLRQIKQDDLEIEEEGVEELTEDELRVACRARGMRAPFGEGAVAYMRRQLQDWLDLSLHRGLPSSLLLLSRAFTITASVRDVAKKKDLAYEKIKEQLSVMGDEVVEEVGYEQLGDDAKGIEALQKKLDMLKREELLIKEELSRAAANKEKATAAAAAAAAPKMAASEEGGAAAATAQAAATEPAASAAPTKPSAALSTEERQQRLQKTLQALMELASGSGLAKERAQFLQLLKKDTDRLNEDLVDVMAGPATLTTEGGTMAFGSKFSAISEPAPAEEDREEESAAPKSLTDRVSKMLHDIEKELDNVEQSIGKKMHLLDTDNDGIISQQELEHAVRFLREQLSPEELEDLYAHLGKKAGAPGSFELDKLLEMAADKDFTVAPREVEGADKMGKDP